MIIIPFVDNATIVWASNELPGPDGQWYHCARCILTDPNGLRSRLALSAKFCAECGTSLDWTQTSDLVEISALPPETQAKVAKYRAMVKVLYPSTEAQP